MRPKSHKIHEQGRRAAAQLRSSPAIPLSHEFDDAGAYRLSYGLMPTASIEETLHTMNQ